jgi:hypothetical protein
LRGPISRFKNVRYMKTFLIPVPRQPSFQKLRDQLSIIAKPGVDKLHLLHVTTFPPGTDATNYGVISAGQIMADISKEEEIELAKLATQFKSIGFQPIVLLVFSNRNSLTMRIK